MKYAILENNIVVDVTEANPNTSFHADIASQFYAVNNDDVVNGSSIANPVKDEQAKTITGDWTHPDPIVLLSSAPTQAFIPKLNFKLRFTPFEWIAMEIMAEGTAAVAAVGVEADPEYVAAQAAIEPDRIAKYWLDMYAEPSLENVDLMAEGTISIINYLQSKGKLTAQRGAEIRATDSGDL